MIFVQGTMNMEPSCIPDFVTDVAAMRDKVLAEDGCTFYSLLVEDAATGLVNVVEQWRDEGALLVHFTTPWIGEFMGKYGHQMLASTVQVFDIAGEARPLPAIK
jgi:quinol monooxygenase YgiN